MDAFLFGIISDYLKDFLPFISFIGIEPNKYKKQYGKPPEC